MDREQLAELVAQQQRVVLVGQDLDGDAGDRRVLGGADGQGLEVILPSQSLNELESAFRNEVIKDLAKGLEVKNMKGLANGFQIGPKDGGYRISFTADDFTGLIGEYLRPATKQILFGE